MSKLPLRYSAVVESVLFFCAFALGVLWVAHQNALEAESPKEYQANEKSADSIDVWIGTGKGESKGIYHAKLEMKSGKLQPATLVAEASGPGFLALHPTRPVLYAVCELEQKPVVAAYSILKDGKRTTLRLLNAVEIGDGGAAHLSVEATGRTLLTAQYGSGSVAVFSLQDDGAIRERTQLVKHHGGSQVVPSRQDAPHAHWTGYSPDQRFAFVPDLGMDKVVIYRLDAANSAIEPHGFGIVPPGAGPRHMKFHPNGKFAFVLNELALSITCFAYDAKAGSLAPLETVETVSEKDKAKEFFSSASEIRIHPNNKFVYSANRGPDTISVFKLDESTGHLSLVEKVNCRGATPRNFNIDPSGKWLLVAGQDSHTLASFAINQETGELTYNRSIIHIPNAICVLFQHE